jgi:hypothetical protein
MGLLQVYPPRLLAQLQDLLVLLSLLQGLLLMQGTLALQQAAHPNKPRSKANNHPRPMELLCTLPRAPPCPMHECDLDS